MRTKSNLLPSQAPLKTVHRWVLASIMLVVVALGWKYPVLGFIVPVAMFTGIGGAFSKGRYVCGNICPRGSFYDTLYRIVAGRRPLPRYFLAPEFRWTVVVVLMSFMVWQLSRDPENVMHWGRVFWTMCAVTTLVGVIFGFYYRARTWCAFCPVGTMASAIGGSRYQLEIADHCRGCRVCEKYCPLDLKIEDYKGGTLPHRDCLKCSACVDRCPVDALAFPD